MGSYGYTSNEIILKDNVKDVNSLNYVTINMIKKLSISVSFFIMYFCFKLI